MQTITHLVASGVPRSGVSPLLVEAALARLETKRLGEINLILTKGKGNAGMRILESAKDSIKRSADDKTGDEKLDSAISYFSQEALPAFVETDADVHLIDNFKFVQDGSLEGLVLEATLLVQEALKLWSPIRKSEQVNRMCEFIILGSDLFRRIDFMYTLFVVKATGYACLTDGEPADNEEVVESWGT